MKIVVPHLPTTRSPTGEPVPRYDISAAAAHGEVLAPVCTKRWDPERHTTDLATACTNADAVVCIGDVRAILAAILFIAAQARPVTLLRFDRRTNTYHKEPLCLPSLNDSLH